MILAVTALLLSRSFGAFHRSDCLPKKSGLSEYGYPTDRRHRMAIRVCRLDVTGPAVGSGRTETRGHCCPLAAGVFVKDRSSLTWRRTASDGLRPGQ